MPRHSILKGIACLWLICGFNEAAGADEPDIGGIRLGMPVDDALRAMKSDPQKTYGQLSKNNFTLTLDRAQGKAGTYEIYSVTWRYPQSWGEITIGVSPVTNKVWSITRLETPQSARPSLQAIADAAKKFGKVNARSVTSAEYIQRWMYDDKKTEIEWANVYDKPQNGNCFRSIEAVRIASTSSFYPVNTTGACASVFWVNAASSSKDGQATSFTSVAIDVSAFHQWFQGIDKKMQKSIEDEKNRAAKPTL